MVCRSVHESLCTLCHVCAPYSAIYQIFNIQCLSGYYSFIQYILHNRGCSTIYSICRRNPGPHEVEHSFGKWEINNTVAIEQLRHNSNEYGERGWEGVGGTCLALTFPKSCIFNVIFWFQCNFLVLCVKNTCFCRSDKI